MVQGKDMRVSRKRTRTYVVQVQAGREQRACMLIKRMVSEDIIDEVFIPTYTKQVKRAGEWHEEESMLAPGYLYLATGDIDGVVRSLRAVPALTRVLGTEARFVPLTPGEIDWLNGLTRPGNRTVGVSTGVIEGDQVRIISGPLKGHEALIQRVDRHKRTAEIEFRIMGRSTRVRVGLEIVQKSR